MDHRNPFDRPGNWYKGCLHVHSTVSDGRLSPEEVLAWYRGRGYHFVAITDHNVPSESRVIDSSFIAVSGVEVDGVDPAAGLYHLVGLGLPSPAPARERPGRMQDEIDRLQGLGALVCIAHPYWSGQRSAELMGLKGCFALEVYNGGCEIDDAKGFSLVHWDDLLAAGARLWGLAVDDAHWRNGDHDAGLGWVWVKAPVLSQQAVLAALEAGCFYSSSGPEIHDLAVDVHRGEVSVRCSPVVAIDFVGNGSLSRRVQAAPGQRLTEATYQLRDGQRYVRVACLDANGGWAWSNPFFLAGARS